MKWLKSTTQKQWVINGKIIPRCESKDNTYLTVSDSDYDKMFKQPVFKSLVKANAVLVLDREPSEVRNSIKGLSTSNADLIAKNKELEAKLKALDIDAIKADAVKEIQEEAVKELQEKQTALEEAQKALAEAQKEIKKLKKASKSEDAE